MKTYYVIWDPAPNRVVGQEERWTKLQAERFLRDHREQFSQSAHVTEDVWTAKA